jgi:hypothetical protein
MIEQYLEGTLADGERAWLEQKAAQDPELNNLIRMYREIDESIRDHELNDLHRKVGQVSKDYFETQKEGKGNTRSKVMKPANRLMDSLYCRIAITAAILIITSLAVKWLFFSSASGEKIYRTYYAPYKVDIISRTADSATGLFVHALMNYQLGSYEIASLQLEKITNAERSNYMAWFFLGLSELGEERTADAIRAFSEIPSQWKQPCHVHVSWYLSLSLLKIGQKNEAVELLKDLKQSGGLYAEEAGKILRKLRY